LTECLLIGPKENAAWTSYLRPFRARSLGPCLSRKTSASLPVRC